MDKKTYSLEVLTTWVENRQEVIEVVAESEEDAKELVYQGFGSVVDSMEFETNIIIDEI